MNLNSEWLDPLYLDSFLTEDEKKIRDNTKKFSAKHLFPIINNNNSKKKFDKEIYKEFGKMGLLGSTIKGYGSSEINEVSYGLIASEIELLNFKFNSLSISSIDIELSDRIISYNLSSSFNENLSSLFLCIVILLNPRFLTDGLISRDFEL